MNDRLHPAKASRSAAVKARLDHPSSTPTCTSTTTRRCWKTISSTTAAPSWWTRCARRWARATPRGATARTGTSRRRQSAMTTARCARRGGRGSRATRWTWPPTPCPSCCTSAWPNRAPTIPSCSRTTCWRRWARATRRASRCTAPSTTSTPTSTASTPTASPRGRHPLNTPQEGIEELEFAVKTLGLKVINIAGGVKRPIKAIARKYPADQYPEIARHASYVDFYGIDSEYDYDPFWAKVVELGVPVTTHYGSQGWTGRQSTSNYMFNHIGHFADGSQAFAKALFFGGVTRRFPNLRVALLEGGADWGSHVYTHLVDRWESATARRCRTTTRPTPTSRCCRICSRAMARISSVAANWTRAAAARQPGHLRPAAQPRAARGRAGRFRRRRHRVGRGHPQALGGQLLLRLRGRRPHRGGRLQRPRPSAGREDQRDLVLRHRPLGRARPDRAAGRKLGPGRTGRHQRAGLQGPGVRQSLPPLHRGQSRFLPGHGDRAQARRPPAATDTKTRAA